jgi:hypothetical protein
MNLVRARPAAPIFAVAVAGAVALVSAYAPPASAQGAVNDEVLTNDGGTFRGTIVEHAQGGDVVLLLPSGETRRFAAGDVRYAGPLQAPPQSAPVSGRETEFSVRGPQVSVRFEAPEPTTIYVEDDWTVAYHRSARGYVRLCTSPCTFAMPAGTQHFALATGTDDPRPVGEPVTVAQPSTMRSAIESRKGLRIAGVAILAAGSAAGLGLFAAGYYTGCPGNQADCAPSSASETLEISGLILGMASIIGGVILLTRHDVIGVEVTPLAPVQPSSSTTSLLRGVEGARFGESGAAVTVRF